MIGESSFQSASRSAVPVSWRRLLLTALVLPLAALPLGCATTEQTVDGQSSDTAVTTPTSPSATVPTPGPGSATSGPDAPSADNPGAMTAGPSDSSAPVTPSTPVSPSTPVTPITPVDTATSTVGVQRSAAVPVNLRVPRAVPVGAAACPRKAVPDHRSRQRANPRWEPVATRATPGQGSAMGGSAGAMSASGGAAGTGGASGGSAGQSGTGDAVPSPGCGQMRTLGDGNHTMMSGGQNREYHIKAPSDYDNTRPYRLIFMFHWFYGSIDAVVNPPDADHNTDDPYYGLEDLAGDSSIFVVPQGLNDSGGAGWSNPNNRDVNFTDDMLEAVSNDLCIDTSRVFTMGFSFGGAISYKLACVRSLDEEAVSADRVVGILVEELLQGHLAVELVVEGDEHGPESPACMRPHHAESLAVGGRRADAEAGSRVGIGFGQSMDDEPERGVDLGIAQLGELVARGVARGDLGEALLEDPRHAS